MAAIAQKEKKIKKEKMGGGGEITFGAFDLYIKQLQVKCSVPFSTDNVRHTHMAYFVGSKQQFQKCALQVPRDPSIQFCIGFFEVYLFFN